MSGLFRRLLLALIGRLITPAMMRDAIDIAFGLGRTGTAITPTALDDIAINALEDRIDKDALARTLSAWFEQRIKDGI